MDSLLIPRYYSHYKKSTVEGDVKFHLLRQLVYIPQSDAECRIKNIMHTTVHAQFHRLWFIFFLYSCWFQIQLDYNIYINT